MDQSRLAPWWRALVSGDPPLEVATCASFARDEVSRLHDQAAAFRTGDPAAFETALEIVRDALAGEAGRVLGTRTVGVAIPVHLAGARNRPCERLIEALAAEVPGFVAGTGALVRVADAPEARGAATRDPAAEAATLRWDDALVPAGADRILLVDDVVRTGSTFEAAALAAPPEIRSRLAALAVFRAEGELEAVPVQDRRYATATPPSCDSRPRRHSSWLSSSGAALKASCAGMSRRGSPSA